MGGAGDVAAPASTPQTASVRSDDNPRNTIAARVLCRYPSWHTARVGGPAGGRAPQGDIWWRRRRCILHRAARRICFSSSSPPTPSPPPFRSLSNCGAARHWPSRSGSSSSTPSSTRPPARSSTAASIFPVVEYRHLDLPIRQTGRTDVTFTPRQVVAGIAAGPLLNAIMATSSAIATTHIGGAARLRATYRVYATRSSWPATSSRARPSRHPNDRQ